MSSIVLKGSTSGDVTVQAPAVATGTVTMPSATGTLLTTTGDGSSLTSLTGSQVDSGQTTCKAWCHVQQSGTQAIIDSHNVSSITDNGVGWTTVTWTNNFANVNYCPVTSMGYDSATHNDDHMLGLKEQMSSRAVGSIKLLVNLNTNGGSYTDNADVNKIYVVAFGD